MLKASSHFCLASWLFSFYYIVTLAMMLQKLIHTSCKKFNIYSCRATRLQFLASLVWSFLRRRHVLAFAVHVDISIRPVKVLILKILLDSFYRMLIFCTRISLLNCYLEICCFAISLLPFVVGLHWLYNLLVGYYHNTFLKISGANLGCCWKMWFSPYFIPVVFDLF